MGTDGGAGERNGDVASALRSLADNRNEFAALALAHLESAAPGEAELAAESAASEIRTLSLRLLTRYADGVQAQAKLGPGSSGTDGSTCG